MSGSARRTYASCGQNIRVRSRKPPRAVLLTECSMSDNIAALHLGIDFIRPRNLSPHMKRITLVKIRSALEEMRLEVTIDPAVAARTRRAVEWTLAL
jgi:quinolinate synthase